jgi:hypothetical protein
VGAVREELSPADDDTAWNDVEKHTEMTKNGVLHASWYTDLIKEFFTFEISSSFSVHTKHNIICACNEKILFLKSDFHETIVNSAASHSDLLYRISPKSGDNCRR